MSDEKKVSRRDILKMGTAGAFGIAGSYYLNKMAQFPNVAQASSDSSHKTSNHSNHSNHANMSDKTKTTGYKMAERLLTDFDYGEVTKLPNGQILREYKVVAIDKEIEIAKGIKFPGWTY
ncbi:multicopper oxidase domain-containing protein, partial [Peribacillus simplex]